MKKIVLFFILLFIPFFVYAEKCNDNDITISNISLLDKSEEVVEVSVASIEDNNINLDLKMKNIEDNAKYKLTINNNSEEDYIINQNSINNNSDYITYTLESSDESNIVKSKTSKEVILKVEYTNAISEEVFNDENYKESKTITINLSTGKEKDNNSQEIVNPKTGNFSSAFILVMFVIGFSLIILIINRSKYSKLFVLLFLLIIPFGIKAICNTSINVVSNIEIEKPLNINPSLGNYYNMNTGTYYQHLGDAFSEVANGQTIKVLNNIVETSEISLDNSKNNITLDLNGKKIILKDVSITNNGELLITNESNKEGILEGSEDIFAITNNGDLSLEGITIAGYNGIINEREHLLNINGNNTKINVSVEAVCNYGFFELNDGIINSFISNWRAGTFNLEGGKIKSIINYGELNITNGKIINPDNNAIDNFRGGNILINGIDVEITGGIHNDGNLNIAYGTISGGVTNDGNLRMSDGIITSDGVGIYNCYSTSSGSGLYGNAIITGGTITGKTAGIYVGSQSTVTLGINDGNLHEEIPLIQATGTANNYGIYNNGGTLNYYDGRIESSSGSGYALYGEISDKPTDFNIYCRIKDGIEYLVLSDLV